jgi:glycosyltransferase involved in cell wall biosynthesis
MAEPELDIVIPVYNEGQGIAGVLESLRAHVKTPFRVLICYDREDDDTLPALVPFEEQGMPITRVKNRGRFAFGAVTTGFAESRAPAVLVFPADDDYNAPRLDAMVAKFKEGCDVVCASRFIAGGRMVACPPLKAAIVRSSAWVLSHIARVPTRDPSNGFRLFSQRLLRDVPLESKRGFTYSIELLLKCHRLGWKVGEVPVEWYERKQGQSRFKVLRWLPDYFEWFVYAFGTSYLRRGPSSVVLRRKST